MKVKELIKYLKQFNPKLPVYIESLNGDVLLEEEDIIEILTPIVKKDNNYLFIG